MPHNEPNKTPNKMLSESESEYVKQVKVNWEMAYSAAESRLQEVETERNKLKLAMRLIRRQIKARAPFPGDGGVIGQDVT